jgi:hypothetical protein
LRLLRIRADGLEVTDEGVDELAHVVCGISATIAAAVSAALAGRSNCHLTERSRRGVVAAADAS